MEAMRQAKPGLYEYELFAAAEDIFRKNGSQGAAYFALSATGKNTIYSHYHRGAARLADGDLVQFDYAPDWKYYVSDVTRVFPANGKFHTVAARVVHRLPPSVSVADDVYSAWRLRCATSSPRRSGKWTA